MDIDAETMDMDSHRIVNGYPRVDKSAYKVPWIRELAHRFLRAVFP